MDTIQLTVNGEVKHINAKTSIRSLLEQLDFADKRVAVEVNGNIVPKSLHTETYLKGQDRVEIVVAVGGG